VNWRPAAPCPAVTLRNGTLPKKKLSSKSLPNRAVTAIASLSRFSLSGQIDMGRAPWVSRAVHGAPPPKADGGHVVSDASTLPTVGEIARRLGVRLHRVEYVIRSRDIRPVGRAGNLRIFSDADVEYIRGELRRIDGERGEGVSL
jgi:hypothetical protein